MRKPGHSSEPSIEEILASIRSIITDDAPPVSKVASQPSGGSNRVTHSMVDSENALLDEDDRHAVHSDTSHANATGDAAVSEISEEVLELTEDFMLEEMPQEAFEPDNILPLETPAQETSSVTSFPKPSREEEDLGEVLSNLAAEVERLSTPEAPKEVLPEQATGQDEPGRDSAEPDNIAAPLQADAGALPEAGSHFVGQPQIEGITEPQATAPASPSSPAAMAKSPAPAPRPKQIWSARRLEETGPTVPAKDTEKPDTEDEGKSEAETTATQPQKAAPLSRRDLWAEGVQMPVPESGPEMPLPMLDSDLTVNETQDPESTDQNPDAKRRIVGKFLTRVFGDAPSESEEADTDSAEKEGLRGQAEKLARVTIAAIAEEQLNAPAVGNALKADKDFMDAVANSLEDALAASSDGEAEEVVSESSAEAASPDAGHAERIPAEKPAEPDLNAALKEALDAETGDPVAEEKAVSADGSTPAIPDGDGDAPEPETELQASGATASEQSSSQGAEKQAAVSTAQDSDTENAGDVPEKANAGEGVPLLLPQSLSSSLEGDLKNMIKPLIIQWLNDNLPRIVEEAVREELIERSAIPDVKTKSRA